MKRVLVTLTALASFCAMHAQSADVKDVRQTYLWDVTLSMQGKAPGAPNIWDKVKSALITDIQQISDDRTEIVVIPFQHKELDKWCERATAFGKAALIAKIKAYEIPLHNFNGKMTTRTCLYEPLKYVADNILTPDKVDMVKLMTDGIPDEHQNEYEQLLKRWCQIAEEKDAYGFYIMLTSQAVVGKAFLTAINPCRFDAIDVAELGGTNISLMMLTPQPNIAFNVREDYGKKFTIKFAHNGNGNFQSGYKMHISSDDNVYIKIDQVIELQEDYTAIVSSEYLMSQEQMMNSLPIDENLKIHISIEPANGMDKLPFAMTRILNAPTTIELINKPEKTVKFHVL